MGWLTGVADLGQFAVLSHDVEINDRCGFLSECTGFNAR